MELFISTDENIYVECPMDYFKNLYYHVSFDTACDYEIRYKWRLDETS